jgi:eukaryotic-like serine/threonine-protein kinase
VWVSGPWLMGLIVHAFATSQLGKVPLPEIPVRRTRRRRGSRSGERDELPEDLGSAATRVSERPPPGSAGSMGEVVTFVRERGASAGLQEGQKLAGRFVIERKLGRGGMGEVYLAHDALLGDRVALKTIAADSVTPAALERFRREAQAARRVTHPHVVRIHDVGQDGDLAFISMEYIEGETLGGRVHREGPLSLPEAKRIVLQVCDGLSAAHAAGVVHRDLKPDNILLDRDGNARVIDFGLARLEQAAGLTASGMVMGTPHFMAPEQVQGRPADVRTDVYALGCVLYHVLTGAPPFERESAIAIGMAHCTEQPTSPRATRADVTEAWEQLVMHALEKDPGKRFDSVQSLRDALQLL